MRSVVYVSFCVLKVFCRDKIRQNRETGEQKCNIMPGKVVKETVLWQIYRAKQGTESRGNGVVPGKVYSATRGEGAEPVQECSAILRNGLVLLQQYVFILWNGLVLLQYNSFALQNGFVLLQYNVSASLNSPVLLQYHATILRKQFVVLQYHFPRKRKQLYRGKIGIARLRSLFFAGQRLSLPLYNNFVKRKMEKKYPTIDTIALTRLNKAELLAFLSRVITILPDGDAADGGVESLYIPAELLDALKTCVEKLTQITRESRSSVKTKELAKIDEERNALLLYIFGVVSQAGNLPLEGQREAGKVLFAELKGYSSAHRLPQTQKTVAINSMVAAVSDGGMASHIATLGLQPHIDELQRLNGIYEQTSMLRTREMLPLQDTAAGLRGEAILLYEEVADRAFATSLLFGTQEAADFIQKLNIEIRESKIAYNRRMAQAGREGNSEETGAAGM